MATPISRTGGGRRRPTAWTRRGHTTTTTRVVRGGRSQEAPRGPNVDSRARYRATKRPFRPRIG